MLVWHADVHELFLFKFGNHIITTGLKTLDVYELISFKARYAHDAI